MAIRDGTYSAASADGAMLHWRPLWLNEAALKGTADRIAIPVSGYEPVAKAIIMKPVEETGFDVVNAGLLSDSRRQQPGTPAIVRSLRKAN
ncbi:hypothetical protein HED63_28455 [Ochrobactrum cytisi]|nr:hypothetical protein [Brucella cytisi]